MSSVTDPALTYVCGTTDNLGTRVSRWGIPKLTYNLKESIPQIGTPATRTILDHIFRDISSICGLSFQYTNQAREANLVFETERKTPFSNRMDGPGGTLAYAYLPPTDNFGTRERAQLVCRCDLDEQWKTGLPPFDLVSNRGVFLYHVLYHEIGHLLGLDHDKTNRSQLMNPTYNPNIYRAMTHDSARLIKLYGKSKIDTNDPPHPDPEQPSPLPPSSTISDDEFNQLMQRWLSNHGDQLKIGLR